MYTLVWVSKERFHTTLLVIPCDPSTQQIMATTIIKRNTNAAISLKAKPRFKLPSIDRNYMVGQLDTKLWIFRTKALQFDA